MVSMTSTSMPFPARFSAASNASITIFDIATIVISLPSPFDVGFSERDRVSFFGNFSLCRIQQFVLDEYDRIVVLNRSGEQPLCVVWGRGHNHSTFLPELPRFFGTRIGVAHKKWKPRFSLRGQCITDRRLTKLDLLWLSYYKETLISEVILLNGSDRGYSLRLLIVQFMCIHGRIHIAVDLAEALF